MFAIDLHLNEVWIKNALEKAKPGLHMYIVGTKCDLSERKVTYEERKKFANENGFMLFETISKEGTNIGEMFNSMAKDKPLSSVIDFFFLTKKTKKR